MKFLVFSVAFASSLAAVCGQTIIADNYDVTATTTGFGLNAGVNTGINPPETRLTGTAVNDLRYIEYSTRAANLYTITDNKFRITGGSATAAAVLSANGTAAFNFASALGSGSATPSSPVIYDITISMANNLGGATPRFSLGLGTTEPLDGVGQAGLWDFGLQLHRNITGGTAYSVSKRIDIASGEGLTADDNTVLATTADNTYGSTLDFVIRVTDAGAETDSYSSRIQLSMDGGASFLYDSATDPLITGFRFDGAGRYLTWDVAGNGSNGGYVDYDNFSIVMVPEPSALAIGLVGAAMLVMRRRRN